MLFDAEADFQRLAHAYSRLPRLEATISVSSRAERNAPFYNSIDIWFRHQRPGKFDVLIADLWGNPGRFATDGNTVLTDSFALTLYKAKGDPLDHPMLTTGSGSSPFYGLLRKGSVRDSFQIAGPITKTQGAYEFTSRKYGRTTVYVVDGSGFPSVYRIEYSAKMEALANWVLFPMFSEKPGDALTREDIQIDLDPLWPRSIFSVTPPKGSHVVDMRGG